MRYELPDFDTLLGMARNNPDELEQLRRNLTGQVIDSAPEEIKRRLHGLQFQIDARCQSSSNPMSACIKISQMMHDSLSTMRFVLNNVTAQGEPIPALLKRNRSNSADVIPFRAR